MNIPEGWVKVGKLENLGRVFNGLSGKTKDDFGYGEPYIPYVNVFKNAKVDINELDYVRIRSGEKQNELKFGDIIFTTSSETIEEVGMTSVFLNNKEKIYLNSFCFIYRLSDLNWLIPEFAQFLFRSDKLRYGISLFGQGSTRYNLSKTRLLSELNFLIPQSPFEQRQIAIILSKVDEAISHTEKLIAKYNRIKAGLMQDMLTKGIDEQGNIRSEATHKFKDSSLGRIPLEWEVVDIHAYTKNSDNSVKPGPFGSSLKKEFYTERGYKIYGQEQVISNNAFLGDYFIDEKRYKSLFGFKVNAGDVLLSCVGTIGNVLIIPEKFEEGIINPRLIKFSLDMKTTDKYFFAEYLKHSSINIQLLNLATGGTMPVLNKKIVLSLNFIYPDLSEQKRIVEKWTAAQTYIDTETKHLYKLQSIKTGLMQDLLSGKVRVNHLIKETATV